ncbi:unnamed protein product [Rotaria sp. Silwood1]|nr:unnamed protein product [Rotaria sp. Silwood1]
MNENDSTISTYPEATFTSSLSSLTIIAHSIDVETLTTLILSNDGLDDATQDKYSYPVSNDSETESEMISRRSTRLSTSEYWRRNSMRPRQVNHKIGTQIFQHLAEALWSNMTITSLHVNLIKIKLEEIKYLANALQDNTTMITLILIENSIQNEGVQHLAHALEKNHVNLIVH